MNILNITTVLGGLAIFLHGLHLARDGLQKLAADKLRSIVTTVSRNRLVGLFAGAIVTVIIQSSTATTVMLVGFASAGVVSLGEAMALLLGADIGTSVTVQLLSFRLSTWALLLAFVGLLLRSAVRKRQGRYLGESIFGFGLLFFGLKLMSDGTEPLTHLSGFANAIQLFTAQPLLGVLAAALFTMLLQGSAPTIGLLLSLAHSSAHTPGGFQLTLAAALPMILGANVGTTLMPAISSMGQNPEGKRVALAHVVFKILGVALFLPVLPWFGHLVTHTADDLARQIANAHTMFNVLVALILLPFTNLVARSLTRFYQPLEKNRFRPKYLDLRAIESPALAFGLATREFLRMCDIVGDMLKDSFRVFERNDLDLAEDIESKEDQVDILNQEIRFYLARLGSETMTQEQSERQMTLINLTADIENAGDTVNRNILAMARKKVMSGLQFTAEGLQDLALFHRKVVENYNLAVAAFSTSDEELARKVLRHHDALIAFETELKQKHIGRLHQGLPEALDTSSIHLDLLSNLRRVNSLVSHLASAVMAVQRLPRIEQRSGA